MQSICSLFPLQHTWLHTYTHTAPDAPTHPAYSHTLMHFLLKSLSSQYPDCLKCPRTTSKRLSFPTYCDSSDSPYQNELRGKVPRMLFLSLSTWNTVLTLCPRADIDKPSPCSHISCTWLSQAVFIDPLLDSFLKQRIDNQSYLMLNRVFSSQLSL
jgi:hypothetical protein